LSRARNLIAAHNMGRKLGCSLPLRESCRASQKPDSLPPELLNATHRQHRSTDPLQNTCLSRSWPTWISWAAAGMRPRAWREASCSAKRPRRNFERHLPRSSKGVPETVVLLGIALHHRVAVADAAGRSRSGFESARGKQPRLHLTPASTKVLKAEASSA
jgi:hypothetical protein